MKTLKGVIHLHSRHSFDSEAPLKTIVEKARKIKLQFACVTEHTNELDESRFQAFLKECKSLSSADFLIIPGLEITCEDGTHVLALGLEKWIHERNLTEILLSAKNNRTLFVLAHPSKRILSFLCESPHARNTLHGIEIWNRKYHGLLGPHPGVLRALSRMRKANPHLYGYGGVDFHDQGDLLAPVTIVESQETSAQGILSALKSGRFRIEKGSLNIAPDGILSVFERVRLETVWQIRSCLFRILKWSKRRFINPTTELNVQTKIEKAIRRWL